jgi:hypothetical protein
MADPSRKWLDRWIADLLADLHRADLRREVVIRGHRTTLGSDMPRRDGRMREGGRRNDAGRKTEEERKIVVGRKIGDVKRR